MRAGGIWESGDETVPRSPSPVPPFLKTSRSRRRCCCRSCPCCPCCPWNRWSCRTSCRWSRCPKGSCCRCRYRCCRLWCPRSFESPRRRAGPSRAPCPRIRAPSPPSPSRIRRATILLGRPVAQVPRLLADRAAEFGPGLRRQQHAEPGAEHRARQQAHHEPAAAGFAFVTIVAIRHCAAPLPLGFGPALRHGERPFSAMCRRWGTAFARC